MKLDDADPSDIAVYVTSFDGYSDLWGPFFQCFWRHWSDCPFQVFLGGTSKGFDDERVKFLHSTEGKGWSDRAIEHLGNIRENYVLMFLEDWFLKEFVDTAQLVSMIEQFKQFDGEMLRLVPDPKPTVAIGGCPEFGYLGLGLMNRSNTHATIWKRETLMALIKEGESLWEFEVFGAIRSNQFSGGFFSVWERQVDYCGAVDAGKYTREAIRMMHRRGIAYDANARAQKTLVETIKWKSSSALRSILRLFTSLRMRQNLQRIILGHTAKVRK